MKVEKVLLRAKFHERKGEIGQARTLYKDLLREFPKNKRAQQSLAAMNKHASDARVREDPPLKQLKALLSLHNEGQLETVCECARVLLSEFPRSFFLWNIFGAVNRQLGNFPSAERSFRNAEVLNPNSAEVHNSLGLTLQELGKPNCSLSEYICALKIKPNFIEAHYNMGNAFQELKRFEEATTAYKNALAIEPNFFEAFFNMGAALRCNGELDAAVAAYKQAIAIQPDYVAAHNNLGTTLRLQNKTDAAITAFKRAIEIRPDYAEAYFNLGNAFQTQHKLDSAISAYESAILLKPKYAEVYNNMGAALQAKRELHAAQLALEFATRTSPDYAEAHCNLGSVLQEQGQFTEAINAFKRTLQIRPDHAVAEANLLHQKHQIGDWQAYDQLGSVCERLGITTNAVTGFTMLSKEDDPGRQLARAKAWVAENYTQSSIPIAARLDSLPRRLRIGYFSADFHDHPVLFLISGLLRNYSRDQFEVIAFSYGGPNESEMRKLVERNVDHFVEITQKENSDIVEMARGYELDIAIDLNGYTQNTRSDLFQFRLAPIQINYLGYPSTTGATFMDYMVADPISLPQSERKFYSENIIYMPDSWVPYDDCREISRCKTTPSDFGLPEDAFVFCCFNNSYKISPREFNIWMRILTNVPDSVLWLFSSNKWVEKNLRREAVVRNVDPERLIFAEKIPHAEYLARYRHADLFLDTFNFNAITTGSDALWAGLPIVTKSGRQFCARSTASLLNAVGLSELITETESEYEALILDLALDREKLSEIKNKLKKNLSVEPLFDTKRYTRNFENGLLQAYHLHFSGKRAEDIWVRSSPPQ